MCEKCEGFGGLDGERMSKCEICNGTGIADSKIRLNRRMIEDGIERLISEQVCVMRKLNQESASSESECLNRLDLIQRRKQNDYILNYVFGLQNFQYTKENFNGVEIV